MLLFSYLIITVIMCLMPKVTHQSITTFSSPHDLPLPNVSLPNFDLSFDSSLISDCMYIDTNTSMCSLPNPTILKILQLNIRGMVNKQDDLGSLLHRNHIDIALLCETWLNDINIGQVHILGYDLVY